MLTDRVRSHPWLVLLTVLVALPIAGCGSDAEPKSDADNAARTTQNPPSSSKLIDALKESKVGSRERAIYSLYYYARWGDYPALVRLYDSEVRRTIRSDPIASVYADNRGRFLSVDVPKIVNRRFSAQGVSLNIELRAADGSVIQETYLLRRRKGGWGIAYDTFFDRAYGETARAAIDGPAGKPSARGTQAARRASSRFRNLSL